MKKFLHVGCGSRKKDRTTSGFNNDTWQEVRFDIDKSYSPDIIGNMTDMAEIKDSSMDAVFSHHSIEHLYYHEILIAIKEFFRVLKSDGFLLIVCPDLRSICELVVQDRLSEEMFESPMGRIAPIDMIYGHRLSIKNGATSMAHCTGFTRTTLVDILRSAGFKSFAAVARPYPYLDIWAFASKCMLNRDELRSLVSEHYPGKATDLPWKQMTGLAN